jgi:outer membrane protein TolC
MTRCFALAVMTALLLPAQAPRQTMPGSTGVPLGQPLPKPKSQRVVGGGPVLTIEEVLASVERNYPPLLAALQERVLADADVLSAEGQFDLRLRSGFTAETWGFYDTRRFSTGVEQPLQWQGCTVSSGYRLGTGNFADYDGKNLTQNSGEVFGSARMPLLRDRDIDSRRATLRKTLIGRKLADLSIDQQKLALVQTAQRRYWDWVFSGRRYAIAFQLLEIAQERDQQLRDAVNIGLLPQVEVVENQRIVSQRKAAVVDATRGLQQASFELSLFVRDDTGSPLIPGNDRLPDAFPAVRDLAQDRAMQDIAAALQYRPEVQRIDSQIGQTEIDVELSKNQLKPNIDIFSTLTSQVGATNRVARGPQELVAGVEFVLPFQRRQAKGALGAAEARKRILEQRLRFQKDQIVTEVRDALSAVENARERVAAVEQELEYTRRMEEAEGLKYSLGDSTLFVLNLRERDTADAALRVAGAQADYQRAVAYYEFTVAQALR